MKKLTMFAKYILIISSLLFLNCKKTKAELKQEMREEREEWIKKAREEADKEGWTAEISSPLHYPCIGQHIYFFNKGKIIANAATLTNIL